MRTAKVVTGRAAVLVGVLAAGLAAGGARADVRDFVWTYQWYTPTVGEKEVEAWFTYKSDAHEYEPQIEFETGLTDRWGVGAYLTFHGEDHQSFRWHAVKLENRYRFGKYRPGRVLHAAYLEIAKEDKEPVELEGKWLMSVYTKNDHHFALNAIAEQKLSSHAPLEFGYAAGWSKGRGNWRAGVETTGQFTDQEFYVGPTVVWDAAPGTRVLAGVMGGLTAQSNDFVGRLLVQHEFF
ncbi:MAG: hypothetical protein HYU66_19205 [Armatimonadetes bacterium]|nr:hypothetical protein [Armatimonadota bacterium]